MGRFGEGIDRGSENEVMEEIVFMEGEGREYGKIMEFGLIVEKWGGNGEMVCEVRWVRGDEMMEGVIVIVEWRGKGRGRKERVVDVW